jgi:hypothetical protein
MPQELKELIASLESLEGKAGAMLLVTFAGQVGIMHTSGAFLFQSEMDNLISEIKNNLPADDLVKIQKIADLIHKDLQTRGMEAGRAYVASGFKTMGPLLSMEEIARRLANKKEGKK